MFGPHVVVEVAAAAAEEIAGASANLFSLRSVLQLQVVALWRLDVAGQLASCPARDLNQPYPFD